MMAKAQPAPGKPKALLGEISVTVRREASRERLAIGTCGLPSSSRMSAWISSEQITRSCFSRERGEARQLRRA